MTRLTLRIDNDISTRYNVIMGGTHFILILKNPAFTEEEGVTVKDGKAIAFKNSAGIPRMLRAEACGQVPPNDGLYATIKPRRNTACKKCRALYDEHERKVS